MKRRREDKRAYCAWPYCWNPYGQSLDALFILISPRNAKHRPSAKWCFHSLLSHSYSIVAITFRWHKVAPNSLRKIHTIDCNLCEFAKIKDKKNNFIFFGNKKKQ